MKGFESEVTYRFDDHWHAKLSMTSEACIGKRVPLSWP